MLAKTKLNSIEVLNFKTLIDSCISHNEVVLVNHVLKEYDDMKEGIKSLWQSTYKTMWSYCLKCIKYTENKVPQVVKAKKRRIRMLLSRFIKEQEGSGLFSSLGIQAPSSRIRLVGPLCFRVLTSYFQMNEILNKFCLAGDALCTFTINQIFFFNWNSPHARLNSHY